MASLKIGKSYSASDRLSEIRSRLMGKGRTVSDKDASSSYEMAVEMAITGIFEDVPEIVCDAVKVLKDPPSTWDRYMAMHNGKAIYEMEFGELREAVKRDLKSGHSELHVHKEMTHVLAASLYMALIDNY